MGEREGKDRVAAEAGGRLVGKDGEVRLSQSVSRAAQSGPVWVQGAGAVFFPYSLGVDTSHIHILAQCSLPKLWQQPPILHLGTM